MSVFKNFRCGRELQRLAASWKTQRGSPSCLSRVSQVKDLLGLQGGAQDLAGVQLAPGHWNERTGVGSAAKLTKRASLLHSGTSESPGLEGGGFANIIMTQQEFSSLRGKVAQKHPEDREGPWLPGHLLHRSFIGMGFEYPLRPKPLCLR